MKNQFETTDFEKVKTAIFILAQAIENGRIQGVCHGVTEALYLDSEIVASLKTYCNGELCTCGYAPTKTDKQ